MAEWLVRETQNLLIAVSRRSNARPNRIFANLKLISFFFLIELSRAAFCRVLASVYEANLHLCVIC